MLILFAFPFLVHKFCSYNKHMVVIQKHVKISFVKHSVCTQNMCIIFLVPISHMTHTLSLPYSMPGLLETSH